MPRFHWSLAVLTLACLAGCNEQPAPPATPPASPVLGKPAPSADLPNAPNATDKKSGDPAPKDPAPANPAPADSDSEKSTARLSPATDTVGPPQVMFDLNYITDGFIGAVVSHPKRAMTSDFATQLREEGVPWDEQFGEPARQFTEPLGVSVKDIEEAIVLIDRRTVDSLAGEAGLQPATESGEPAPKGAAYYQNSLKQIGLAFHNYHDVFGKFPKAGGPAEASADVTDGLSWRVYLLPFVDEVALYNEFHLNEPWDSDHNKTLIEKMPAIYSVRGVEDAGKTSIHVFTGAGALFADNAAPGFRDIIDGTSNTLLAVVAGADTADVWTKPGGLEVDPDMPLACLGTLEGKKGPLVIFGDGAVRTLPAEIAPADFAALVTKSGAEIINLDAVAGDTSSAPFGLAGATPEQAPVIAITVSSPLDQQAVAEKLLGTPEAKTHEGSAYFAVDPWAIAFPNDRTVLFGSEARLLEMLAQSKTETTSPLAKQLQAVTDPFDFALVADLRSHRQMIQAAVAQNPMVGPAANIETVTVLASISSKPGEPLLKLDGTAATPEAAQTLAAMFNGLALNQLKAAAAQQAQNPSAPADQLEVLELLTPGIQALEMKAEGTALSFAWPTPEGIERLPKLLAPQIKGARGAAEATQRMNHFKQIGLAFHNYHDVWRAFPKAGGAATEDPSQKGALSWRVHLLPYLDQAPLYNQFKLDEPWDSDHNKTLIELMPEIFKVKGIDEAGKTSVHVFIGPGAPFADEAAPKVAEFTDGLSNVLLCVEAGPDTAEIWTKPGGLDFDPEDPLKALGEIGEEFLVLLGDGSVRRVPTTIDLKTLTKLIQHSDGEPIEIP